MSHQGNVDEVREPGQYNAPVEQRDPNRDELELESEPRFFTSANFLIALPNMLIPLLYGYHIGLVGVYSTLYKWATDCEMYGAQTPCETLSNAKCKWAYVDQLPGGTTGGYMCQWADRLTCSLHYYYDEPACNADSTCQWNYNDDHCANQVGYKSIMSGLFAGSMIMGAMFGSMFGGAMTKKLNFRLSFLIIGIISTVAAVLTHVTTGIFEYWLLFVARIIVGFPMGWQAVASPAYVAAFGAKSHQKTLGTLFQVFTAFGSFVSAIVGIGVGQSIKFDKDTDANLMGRMQGFVSLPTLLSVLVMGLYFIARDLPTEQTAEEVAEMDSAPKGSDAEPIAQMAKPQVALKQYTVMEMIGPIAMGFCMACTLQLTGINAMMNYAPTIMSNLGLEPLVGNIIVIGWNSITAFGVIPLSRYFRMRTLFLVFTLAGSIACLFLCGIPVYPGVTPNTSAKEGIAITGIALFIMSYEFGIGPCFFVLAADVFPASFRPLGASLTVMFQFVFNLIINICYPIATEGISGGPGGDQDKGQAVAFIFFGCIGFVTVAVEFFFLHPWVDEETDRAIADTAAEEEMPAA